MARCLISFGANLGAPAVTIGQAAQQIQQLLGPRLTSIELSRLFRTPAVGGPTGQPPFVNAVAALEVSDCSAWDVWHVVREVEQALGRVRQERWEARRIDLDVLLFDDQRIWTPQFKLPHPRMVMRRFILQPALDVAADWCEPVSGWSIASLADALTDAPASILLASGDVRHHQRIVEEAARIARCELVDAQVAQASRPSTHATLAPMHTSSINSRWLSLIPLEDLSNSDAQAVSPPPRLVFLLAPSSPATDAAWEDVNRQIARWMGLCSTEPSSGTRTSGWPLNGPRYLLSTDDLTWAQHEIVAAVEAMDCPVEPIKI